MPKLNELYEEIDRPQYKVSVKVSKLKLKAIFSWLKKLWR